MLFITTKGIDNLRLLKRYIKCCIERHVAPLLSNWLIIKNL
jgi:hypothetical protein